MSAPLGIHLLATDVVDQIAAGEVVERPAHLVKELVENSLDAGASEIEVEYDHGGRRVRVTDNGCGISKDDLALALARHATSKISTADDLWNLNSFGFRGEALASIAAVSRVTVISRTPSSGSAYRVVSEFGRLLPVAPAGGNPGTTILVEDLFENVPARLKFMKSETGESTQIRSTLKAMALANENVEFRIHSKGKSEAVFARTNSFLDRARQVLGHSGLYHATGSHNGFQVEIAYASPHDVVGNSRGLNTFVHGRWVQDRGLQAAVTEAYRGLLMHGEFPIAVVRLRAPKGEVDFNIHPTKSQIKFREPQTAFRAVNHTLREALEKAPWLDHTVKVSPQTGSETGKRSVNEFTRPYFPSGLAVPETQPDLSSAPKDSVGRFEGPEFNAIRFRERHDARAVSVSLGTGQGAESSNTADAGAVGAWSRLQVIGQADLTYIVAQDESRLVLIDQHAAHERVAFERLMRGWQEKRIETQSLLVPITVELEQDGVEALMSIQGELAEFGLEIDQVGPLVVAIRSKPALLKDAAVSAALVHLAEDMLEKGGSFAVQKRVSDLCATMACHSVVRAGQALSNEQMRSLLVQMDEFPLSSFCPHGRPVSVDYTFARLEREFGRLV